MGQKRAGGGGWTVVFYCTKIQNGQKENSFLKISYNTPKALALGLTNMTNSGWLVAKVFQKSST